MGALSSPFVEPRAVPAVSFPTGTTWDGLTIGWQYDLERGMRVKWPGDLTPSLGLRWVWPARQSLAVEDFGGLPVLGRVLTYQHAGLPVLGRSDLVPVSVEFHEHPTYSTYGLPWSDYPRVFADPGAASKHRMPDDSLCLYYPWDPAPRRWRYENGLIQLFEMVADHLHKERWWRHTGGDENAEWLGEDAEHGIPREHRRWIHEGGIAL